MKCIIIGAGPTGLGAAWRLEQLGVDWRLFEAHSHPGGLSASAEADGFTWDLGGHVIFSHYRAFDEMLDRVLPPADWHWHERRAFIRILDRWVPYPFQNNIRHLPPAERDACLDGLRAAAAAAPRPLLDFGEWIEAANGPGLARLFLTPYNTKVWTVPPAEMSVGWMGERVPRPDVERIARNIATGADDTGWGPNRRFRFPRRGGTGAVWTGLAALLPPSRLHYGWPVTGVDVVARTVSVAGKETHRYDALITTMPLDRLAEATNLPGLRAARRLRRTCVHVVGLGFRGPPPPEAADKSWLYFPEPSFPFYRVTVFSNYSALNAPPGCYSLMSEVAARPGDPFDPPDLLARCLAGLRTARLAPAEDAALVHRWTHRIDWAYPIPGLERDAILSEVQPALERSDVLSRGRFGAWKYEVANMDHSFAQGLEAADRLVNGTPEVTVRDPEAINRRA
jgi:protoporphyrinogen oxidase